MSEPSYHARAGDPATSHEAVPKNLTAQCLRVLLAYRDGDAMIDYEAYRRVGMARSGYTHQRCSDLRRFGFIETTGERRKTPMLKWANVCRITKAGTEYLDRVAPRPPRFFRI